MLKVADEYDGLLSAQPKERSSAPKNSNDRFFPIDQNHPPVGEVGTQCCSQGLGIRLLRRFSVGNRLPGAIGIERTHSLRQLGRARPKVFLKHRTGMIDEKVITPEFRYSAG